MSDQSCICVTQKREEASRTEQYPAHPTTILELRAVSARYHTLRTIHYSLWNAQKNTALVVQVASNGCTKNGEGLRIIFLSMFPVGSSCSERSTKRRVVCLFVCFKKTVTGGRFTNDFLPTFGTTISERIIDLKKR
jgi:hypothetical protein